MDSRTKTGYKRLPGRGPRYSGIIAISFSRCSLYLGDDHILSVDNHAFSEDYKRFYFSDIQAIITRETRWATFWSIASSLMCACSLMAALFMENPVGRIFSLTSSGAFLACLLINVIRGPTCICHILTAVQQDQLPSLNRLRVARRVIATLRLAIERVQGKLTREEVKTGQNEAAALSASPPHNLPRSRAEMQQTRDNDGTVHT